MNIDDVNARLSDSGISVHSFWTHSKASEAYLAVTIPQGRNSSWDGAIPIQYRRTGVWIEEEQEAADYLQSVRKHFMPSAIDSWKAEQIEFWANNRGDVTPKFFDVLLSLTWTESSQFPETNNPQRRIQALKEVGYTIASRQSGRQVQRLLVPLPRSNHHGYETISASLRNDILDCLGHFDAYEARVSRTGALLPDHKFPEIRWDSQTAAVLPETMPCPEIQQKFQLLTNQRNLQKREACRQCFQTGERGHPFGIPFFYAGSARWPNNIPRTGRDAEHGCYGCGWYDLSRWRSALSERLTQQ